MILFLSFFVFLLFQNSVSTSTYEAYKLTIDQKMEILILLENILPINPEIYVKSTVTCLDKEKPIWLRIGSIILSQEDKKYIINICRVDEHVKWRTDLKLPVNTKKDVAFKLMSDAKNVTLEKQVQSGVQSPKSAFNEDAKFSPVLDKKSIKEPSKIKHNPEPVPELLSFLNLRYENNLFYSLVEHNEPWFDKKIRNMIRPEDLTHFQKVLATNIEFVGVSKKLSPEQVRKEEVPQETGDEQNDEIAPGNSLEDDSIERLEEEAAKSLVFIEDMIKELQTKQDKSKPERSSEGSSSTTSKVDLPAKPDGELSDETSEDKETKPIELKEKEKSEELDKTNTSSTQLSDEKTSEDKTEGNPPKPPIKKGDIKAKEAVNMKSNKTGLSKGKLAFIIIIIALGAASIIALCLFICFNTGKTSAK